MTQHLISKPEYCAKCASAGITERCKYCFCMNYGDIPSGYRQALTNAVGVSDQSIKADAGKLQLTLVPTQLIYDVAVVRMFGCFKYGDVDGWKKVGLERYLNAAYRHWLAFLQDPTSIDVESGLHHYKHVACNIAFICEIMANVIEAGGDNEESGRNNSGVQTTESATRQDTK